MKLEPVFTVKEYAAAKKISIKTVRRLIAAGKLEVERPSARSVRIKLPTVDQAAA